MKQALVVASICSLMIAASIVSPAFGQREDLDGERLENWRIAFDRAAERAEGRAQQRGRATLETDFAAGDTISLPGGERPLRRLIQSGWNVIDIAVSGTVMTTPASWFHDVVEPEKYRQGKQVIDGWLSTTEPTNTREVRGTTTSDNPLHRCAVYLSRALEFLQREVRDSSYVLYKRERLGGRLQKQQQMFTRVRFARDETETFGVSEVFVAYRAPESHLGRRIVYKRGENDGKMLVRMGSGLASNLTLKISPDSRLAKLESQFLITDTGPVSSIRRLLVYIEDTIRIDPRGEVTKVSYFKDSKVAGRSCLAVVITFLEKRAGLEREKAIVFVDTKTYVPIYLATFDWPATSGAEPQLHEEFIFTDLRFNVGLKDSHFRLDAEE